MRQTSPASADIEGNSGEGGAEGRHRAASGTRAVDVFHLPEGLDPEILREFVEESRQYIEEAEAALLALELDPANSEALNTVFRAFHTIKGTSAFLGLSSVTEFSHKAESFLSRMRNGEIRCTGGYADLALRAADMLKGFLQVVEQSRPGQPLLPPDGYAQMLALLENPDASLPDRRTDDLPSEPRATARADVQADRAAAPDPDSDPRPAAPGVERAQVGDGRPAAAGSAPGVAPLVRVRTERLDRLIDAVGELVIAHSMVAQDAALAGSRHLRLIDKVDRLGKIVRDLQDMAMSMRMVPLKPTFQKMARLVRDLSSKSGKVVDLRIEGEDTEIDRNMVEKLSDPLLHLVRNAVDHGIEPPDLRQKTGKPATGTLRLSASHARGNVVIELQDDGKGLDREAIVEKAVAQGLIEPDATLTDRDVFNLIFAPGFSTAAQVTDVSGRGVGMDVVKRHVEALRGRIDIHSVPGAGTTFTLRLPLTLAVTDGMLLRVGPERYILPITSICLSFRPQPESLFTAGGHAEMVLFRGELLPVVRLSSLFHIAGAVEEATEGLLVILDDGGWRYALLVDELLGQQQVVVKPLAAGIGHVPGISGAAILGDGRVGLILDPAGLADRLERAPRPGCAEVSRVVEAASGTEGAAW